MRGRFVVRIRPTSLPAFRRVITSIFSTFGNDQLGRLRQPTPGVEPALANSDESLERWLRPGASSPSPSMSTEALSLSQLRPAPVPTSALESKLLRLVERIRADDTVAFEELYRLTRDDVARTLSHLMGRRSDLEDLIQETYLRLLKAVHNFRGESQFRTFLYRVCANVALMHQRWWRRRREDLVDELPDQAGGEDPEASAQAAESSRLVQRALQQLTAKKRIVFVYHELCGMGPEEIAQAVGASYNTVRSRLHHARIEFTEALRELTRTEVAP